MPIHKKMALFMPEKKIGSARSRKTKDFQERGMLEEKERERELKKEGQW